MFTWAYVYFAKISMIDKGDTDNNLFGGLFIFAVMDLIALILLALVVSAATGVR